MRRSAGPHNPGVSLFPFLAVLICTMGVMMLLLVVCNRPGADEGKSAAAGSAVETDLDTAREMLAWRIAQLESARQKTEGDLADRRLRLSAVEEHMRKLREQWQGIERAAKDMERAEQDKGAAVRLTEAQIAQLRQAVEQTKGQVVAAAERMRNAQPSFAIIPYEGPNGTRRRPIYIECGPESLTIQPEGIVLTANDFEGPDGPGNPLATILRAARDYLSASNPPGAPPSEPYPLLIVRPDGIEMFYVARQAMSSWASEFGYELIEQDRKLAFPQPLPQLAQTEQVALTDARARFAWYAQNVAPRKEASGPRPKYRASVTGGGIVRVDDGGGPEIPGLGGGGGRGTGGRGQGAGGVGEGTGSGGSGNGGTAAGGTGDLVAMNGAPVYGGAPAAPPGSIAYNGGIGGGSNASGSAGRPNAASSNLRPPTSDLRSPATADPRDPKIDPRAPTYDYRSPPSGSESPGDGMAVPRHIARPGEYVESEPVERFKPKPDENEKKPKSLAESRGRNWSLPQSAKISVAVTRQIHIECRGDQMIIKPDTGNPEPQTVPFRGRTEDSVDALVAAVWSHTKGWGIAGRQMYWRPTLVLEQGQSGEGRCGELQALMANSGLEVVRK